MNEELLENLKSNFKEFDWKSINVVFDITDGSIGYDVVEYISKDDTSMEHWIPFGRIRNVIDYLRDEYNRSKESNERFNKFKVVFTLNEKPKFEKYFDEKRAIKIKIDTANIFYQWLNERIISSVFEYEKEMSLLIPNFDEDGEFIDYQDSWDKGYFTLIVDGDSIKHKIELYKQNVSRIIDMSLPTYIVEGVLEHHNITNKELSGVWKQWNKLEILSLNNSIPYDEREKFVNYSLDDKNLL